MVPFYREDLTIILSDSLILRRGMRFCLLDLAPAQYWWSVSDSVSCSKSYPSFFILRWPDVGHKNPVINYFILMSLLLVSGTFVSRLPKILKIPSSYMVLTITRHDYLNVEEPGTVKVLWKQHSNTKYKCQKAFSYNCQRTSVRKQIIHQGTQSRGVVVFIIHKWPQRHVLFFLDQEDLALITTAQ